MLTHLLVVGTENSGDLSPAGLRQEAKKREAQWWLRPDRGGDREHPPLHVFFTTARYDGPQTSEMWLEVEEEVKQTGRLQGGAASRFVWWRRHIAHDAKRRTGASAAGV